MLTNLFFGFIIFAGIVHGLFKLIDSSESNLSYNYNNIFDFIFDIKK